MPFYILRAYEIPIVILVWVFKIRLKNGTNAFKGGGQVK